MATPLDEFLRPLSIDVEKIHALASSLRDTFLKLALESKDQFLPTPISDSILRPDSDESGKYLAIDIGGTNLRVGFIELSSPADKTNKSHSSPHEGPNGSELPEISRVQRHLEKSWPIREQLKSDKADDLFAWIGRRIAEVMQDGCAAWPGGLPMELPLGVTFSFPMIQHTLSDATLMSMGKGFAITSNLDLAKQLLNGYELARLSRAASLPKIKITAIANDAVATLVSFAYQYRSNPRRKAAMGLIVGTGCNATIPLALSKLHPSKRPTEVKVLDKSKTESDVRIAVNTEWAIKGAAGPLYELNFVTRWDTQLDREGKAPGFQPFEYMTSGGYLGELGRIIIVDYFTNHLHIPISNLPPGLQQRLGLTTTFLGNLGPHLADEEPSMVKQLEAQLHPAEIRSAWHWTPETALVVFKIAKVIQVRAAGMVAAATIALLASADEIHLASNPLPSMTNGNIKTPVTEELMVGYTGGCIVHFQDYLADCQTFLDAIMQAEAGKTSEEALRVVLKPCHDGGIIGAGILAGTVQNIAHDA